MAENDVEKILEKVNSDEFKNKQAALLSSTIKEAVEVKPISEPDLEEAKKGGKVRGDPIFECGR
jgi:hypothetical protein